MKFLVAFSCLLAVAVADPSYIASPLAYSGYGAYGAYGAYGVAAPVKAFSYSSVTPHLAPLAYSAPIAYSSQVVSAPIAAPIAYSSQVVAAPVVTKIAAPIAAPVAAPIAYAAPVAVAAPVIAEKTQYHAQDELGQAAYGHSEAFQNHNAVQDAAGNKAGSYNYVAPDGQVISASYVADSLGYRVASNALPVGPLGPIDTPEVVAARAAHLHEVAVAKSRSRRSVLAYGAPLAYNAPLAYHSPLAYSAPLAYSTPLVSGHVVGPVSRAATLTTVVNNPGHAVSYRVD